MKNNACNEKGVKSGRDAVMLAAAAAEFCLGDLCTGAKVGVWCVHVN